MLARKLNFLGSFLEKNFFYAYFNRLPAWIKCRSYSKGGLS